VKKVNFPDSRRDRHTVLYLLYRYLTLDNLPFVPTRILVVVIAVFVTGIILILVFLFLLVVIIVIGIVDGEEHTNPKKHDA
jgi:hypothetical protein